MKPLELQIEDRAAELMAAYPNRIQMARILAHAELKRITELSAANAQLAEYKRDAERYRWLRDKAEFGSHHDPAVANGTCEHLTIFVGEELDRELDAAMDQTEQKR